MPAPAGVFVWPTETPEGTATRSQHRFQTPNPLEELIDAIAAHRTGLTIGDTKEPWRLSMLHDDALALERPNIPSHHLRRCADDPSAGLPGAVLWMSSFREALLRHTPSPDAQR